MVSQLKNKQDKQDKQRMATRLLVEAALDLTRLGKPMRGACLLVLADGMTLSKAAREIKGKRQHVHRALRAVKPKLAELQQFAEGLK